MMMMPSPPERKGYRWKSHGRRWDRGRSDDDWRGSRAPFSIRPPHKYTVEDRAPPSKKEIVETPRPRLTTALSLSLSPLLSEVRTHLLHLSCDATSPVQKGPHSPHHHTTISPLLQCPCHREEDETPLPLLLSSRSSSLLLPQAVLLLHMLKWYARTYEASTYLQKEEDRSRRRRPCFN